MPEYEVRSPVKLDGQIYKPGETLVCSAAKAKGVLATGSVVKRSADTDADPPEGGDAGESGEPEGAKTASKTSAKKK